MTDLDIDRLVAHVAPGSGLPGAAGTELLSAGLTDRRVHGLLTDLVGPRLEQAFAAVTVPAGEWCIRRIDLSLELDPQYPDPDLEQLWVDALVGAVRSVVSPVTGDAGGVEVLHYPRRADALRELVCDLAVGRTERAWAWQQLGLLGSRSPDGPAERTAAALGALAGCGGDLLPILVQAAVAVGIDPLHRLFTDPGWQKLARQAGGSGNLMYALGDPPAAAVMPDPAGAGQSLAESVLARSTLADRFSRARVRPQPGTALAWAALAAAEVEPSLAGRPTAGAVLHRVAARLAGHADMVAPRRADGEARSADDAMATNAVGHDRTEQNSTSGTDETASQHTGPAGPGKQAATAPAGPATTRGSATATEPDVAEIAGRAGQPGTADASSGDPRQSTGQLSDAPSDAGQQPDPQRPEPEDVQPRRRTLTGDQDVDATAAAAAGGPGGMPVPDAAYGESAGPDRSRHAADPETDRSPDPGADQLAEHDHDIEADGRRSWPTEWAGLLFVLGAAPAAGIPDQLLTDRVLVDRPLSWLLIELGRRMVPGCPSADPALAALAGLDPARPTIDRPAPAGPDEDRALTGHARRWAAAVGDRLDRPEQAQHELLGWLARRPGRLLIEPGWTDLILPLEAVELDIRRAGLDIDPGWLPWLGRVIRYRYE